MPATQRSLGLAALGWFLTARGLAEPIEESFFRIDENGMARLGKLSRIATLEAARSLAAALRASPSQAAGPQSELFADPEGAPSWLDQFDAALAAPRAGWRLDRVLSGNDEDFKALLDAETWEDRGVILAARIAAWLDSQFGTDRAPLALEDHLAHGWTVDGIEDHKQTWIEAWFSAFRQALAAAPDDLISPLGTLTEFRDWLGQRTLLPPSTPPPQPPTPAPPPQAPTTTTPPSPTPGAAALPPTPRTSSSPSVQPADPPLSAPRKKPLILAFVLIGWVIAMVLGWQWLSNRHGQGETRVQAARAARATPDTPNDPPSAAPAAVPAANLFRTKPTIRPELALTPADLEPAALDLAERGEHEEAVALWRRIVQIQAQDRSVERLPRAVALARLAASLSALERWNEADSAVERSQAILEELVPIRDPGIATAFEMVGDYWSTRERWPLAAEAFRRSVEAYEKTGAENSIAQMMAVNRFAGALRQLGDLSTAEELLRRLVKAFEGAGPGVALESASVSHNLANLLLQTERHAEAREHYEKALSLLTRSAPDEALASRMAVQMAPNYERALIATGESAEQARIKALRATSRASATPLDRSPGR